VIHAESACFVAFLMLSTSCVILGASDFCIATHSSDMAVALRALGAVVETLAVDGTRRSIPIADFHCLPGDSPHIETALQPGKLVTAVVLPPPRSGIHLYRSLTAGYVRTSSRPAARPSRHHPIVEVQPFPSTPRVIRTAHDSDCSWWLQHFRAARTHNAALAVAARRATVRHRRLERSSLLATP
jgi:FAD binding domain in molybdopterin dehydrogenase